MKAATVVVGAVTVVREEAMAEIVAADATASEALSTVG